MLYIQLNNPKQTFILSQVDMWMNHVSTPYSDFSFTLPLSCLFSCVVHFFYLIKGNSSKNSPYNQINLFLSKFCSYCNIPIMYSHIACRKMLRFLKNIFYITFVKICQNDMSLSHLCTSVKMLVNLKICYVLRSTFRYFYIPNIV